ncbi:unnamed protein product [Brassicogethes aeneus]|uniref:Uncharacterized protein n=1 Tax=Brassicogethes aeneus TaxID=1431903 RepID=A0A9P0B3Y6_BRAAE|nr:unnamed protein product [Brassicogethes aeneus]
MSNVPYLCLANESWLLSVVDSRARTDADGALQAQARRQFEVFQSQVPGGHLQVIKTHTVSTSRWSSNKGATTAKIANGGADTNGFENLQENLQNKLRRNEFCNGRVQKMTSYDISSLYNFLFIKILRKILLLTGKNYETYCAYYVI